MGLCWAGQKLKMKEKYIKKAKPYWEGGNPLKAGELLYERIRQNHRPLWALEVLELCMPLTKGIIEIDELCNIIRNPNRWAEAHEAFSSIRELTLNTEDSSSDRIYTGVLYLAENVAKVTYNASGEPAPFDYNSGCRIVSNLRYIVDQLGDRAFENKAWYVVSCEKHST
jgi:hypothetical protein